MGAKRIEPSLGECLQRWTLEFDLQQLRRSQVFVIAKNKELFVRLATEQNQNQKEKEYLAWS